MTVLILAGLIFWRSSCQSRRTTMIIKGYDEQNVCSFPVAGLSVAIVVRFIQSWCV